MGNRKGKVSLYVLGLSIYGGVVLLRVVENRNLELKMSQ
jgi:hypothetical protein